MNYDGNSFDGRVKSASDRCRRARTVVLKKETSGGDKKVGSDKTSRRGVYSIRRSDAKGTYYTVALKKTYTDRSGQRVICAKDRSPREKA